MKTRTWNLLMMEGALALGALAAGAAPGRAVEVKAPARPQPPVLADYQGKQPVVLLFMRGFTGEFACFHCSKQVKAFQDDYEKFKAAGAEVCVLLPGATDATGFLQKVAENLEEKPGYKVSFPILLDTDLSICKAFQVPTDTSGKQPFPVSEPATVVLDRQGKVLLQYHGKDPSDRPALELVLAALTEKKAGIPSAAKLSTSKLPTLDWQLYEKGLAQARLLTRPVLLEFYGDW